MKKTAKRVKKAKKTAKKLKKGKKIGRRKRGSSKKNKRKAGSKPNRRMMKGGNTIKTGSTAEYNRIKTLAVKYAVKNKRL